MSTSFGKSDFSIVTGSMGYPDLIGLFLESLTWHSSRRYEVCVGLDPEGNTDETMFRRWNVKRKVAAFPGMKGAMDAAIEMATGEWLIFVHDDMVFLPGWDDFDFGLQKHRILCFELIDWKALTWPPYVAAGTSPQEYDHVIACEAATVRRANAGERPRSGGPFFGTCLVNRSKWVPWPKWSDTVYATHDSAWIVETHRTHPDLAFGWMPGNCLYHFISGSVRHKRNAYHGVPGQFEATYGASTTELESSIFAHSRRIW